MPARPLLSLEEVEVDAEGDSVPSTDPLLDGEAVEQLADWVLARFLRPDLDFSPNPPDSEAHGPLGVRVACTAKRGTDETHEKCQTYTLGACPVSGISPDDRPGKRFGLKKGSEGFVSQKQRTISTTSNLAVNQTTWTFDKNQNQKSETQKTIKCGF